jgi:hypothetical protein
MVGPEYQPMNTKETMTKYLKRRKIKMKQTKIRSKILQITDKITSWHFKLFTYVAHKSKTSFAFTILLLFLALYKIFEHFVIPAILIWWGLK